MNQIKQIIKDGGLSQVTVAEMTGVHQTRLSLILNGKCEPNKNEARKIEAFFQAPLELLKEA